MSAEGAVWHPSSNFTPRRGGVLPDMIVLHYTAMSSAEAALERLCSPGHEVSAHYLIGRRGELWQLVAEGQRAWHAGAGSWGAVGDVNSRSIGIELDNDGKVPFPEPQMSVLESLVERLMVRWHIPPERVIAHSDMAPTRKFDPGVRFDWRRLSLRGLAVWPSAGTICGDDLMSKFLAAARQFGYPEAPPEALLTAVRHRFRPQGRGDLCVADVAAITDIAQRYPVDRREGCA